MADRVVQASLKLVLEPVFEADFLPYSYGFRPNRRAHDAIAETRYFASHSYEWVVEGDITACFDEISHTALMDRVRNRIGQYLWGTAQEAASGNAQLPAGPVRGRLPRTRLRQPGSRRGIARGRRGGADTDGPSPVSRENEDHPH
ncbi:reverse transcriptase domain-containing protein [Streptomyces atratus]|uniref:reverse transcriptase domain-containing protein n=1 Tax=Streptomyces atratus TaxID=1893 RepID=UPI00340B717E